MNESWWIHIVKSYCRCNLTVFQCMWSWAGSNAHFPLTNNTSTRAMEISFLPLMLQHLKLIRMLLLGAGNLWEQLGVRNWQSAIGGGENISKNWPHFSDRKLSLDTVSWQKAVAREPHMPTYVCGHQQENNKRPAFITTVDCLLHLCPSAQIQHTVLTCNLHVL